MVRQKAVSLEQGFFATFTLFTWPLLSACVCVFRASSITQRKRRRRIASETLMSMSVRDGQTMFNLCANFCAPGLHWQPKSPQWVI